MSIFILKNDLDKAKFKTWCNRVFVDCETVEVKVKHPVRTTNQNSYLHLLIGYFAVEYGCDRDYAKVHFFKETANPTTFIRTRETSKGIRWYLRSTAELTTEEMSMAIDKFKVWSATEAQIYLPEAENQQFCEFARQQIENNEEYL